MVRVSQQWFPRSRRAWLVLTALLVLVGAAIAAGKVGPPYYHARAADQALQHYDFESAQKHLDACLHSWPNSAATHLLAARTARRRGSYEDAERHLEACERLQGVGLATARERAMLRAQQGDLGGIETPLRTLVQDNDPDAPLALEALARGYLATNDFPQTIDCLDRLLKLQPDHFPALLLRGTVLETLRDEDEAARDYERAVAVNPASAAARLRLAALLEHLGRTGEAVGHYEYLRRRPPVAPEVIVGLARCRFDLDETTEARRLLDELLVAHPDHVAALVERGRLALREVRPEAAERLLRRAVELAPFDRDAHRVLVHCLHEEGKDDEAAKVQARLGRIEADLMRITNLKVKMGDFPHDPELRREIGVLLIGLGEEQQGLGWLASALHEDPRHAPTHAALADYFERSHRPDDAARHRRLAQPMN